MAESLSSMIEYARAKQPRNGLAEVANHFIQGASQGYEAGKKAKLAQYEQILKAAETAKNQEEARKLKMQNDFIQASIDEAKGQGQMPLTAGENMNGRVTIGNTIGGPTKPTGNSTMAKIAAMFTPDGFEPTSYNVTLPTGGTMKLESKTRDKSGKTPDPYAASREARAAEKEDRSIRDKAHKDALAMTQGEDPLAIQPAKKYLRIAYENQGVKPEKYMKPEDLSMPENPDPWGLRGGN